MCCSPRTKICLFFCHLEFDFRSHILSLIMFSSSLLVTKIIPQLNYLKRQMLGFVGLYKDQNIVFIIFYLSLLTLSHSFKYSEQIAGFPVNFDILCLTRVQTFDQRHTRCGPKSITQPCEKFSVYDIRNDVAHRV